MFNLARAFSTDACDTLFRKTSATKPNAVKIREHKGAFDLAVCVAGLCFFAAR